MRKFPLTIATVAMVITPIAAQAQAGSAVASAQTREVSATAMPSLAGAATDQQTAPGEVLVDSLVVVAPNGVIDASPEDLDAVQGGGFWVIILAAGGASIRYCSKNKVTCARGAYKVYSTYKAAVEFARSKGWIN
ncbi:hypothetical protein [Novosphingobium aquae]|uniref:Uncharacterized protein n=1 Tax=Novosphingobium aquae TaxID=3133435 RepID=A0ABU8S8M5_9SPHN